jgi:hypothetical protein
MAMVREIHEAIESIKEESKGWNKSLQTLIFEARGKSLPKPYPLKRTTG